MLQERICNQSQHTASQECSHQEGAGSWSRKQGSLPKCCHLQRQHAQRDAWASLVHAAELRSSSSSLTLCPCFVVQVLSKLPGKCEQVVSVIDTGFHGKSFFMIMEVSTASSPGGKGEGAVAAVYEWIRLPTCWCHQCMPHACTHRPSDHKHT